VAEFQSKILSLLARCDELAEKHQINIFTARLGNPLKTDVELEHPTSLEEAMALARAYKQRLSLIELSLARPSPRSTPSRTPRSGRQLLLPAPTLTPMSAKDVTPMPPRFKCLMATKREKGECYNCTEPFSREHLKTCPMKGIYLLQLDEDPPIKDTPETEDALISLNVITGLAGADTMQLAVRVGNEMLGALVDSGSTHSFTSVATASWLHLDPLPLPGLRVKLANGDRVATAGVCRKTQIYIDTEEFVIDL
jgi:hypothetical protein